MEPLARVKCAPPLSLAIGKLARVRCAPPALSNPVLGVNQEYLHRHKLKGSVLGGILEDVRDAHHLSWKVNGLLDEEKDRRRVLQLSTQLRHCDSENQLEAAATVPLVPTLRPSLQQPCWPPGGWRFFLVVAHTEVLRASRWGWKIGLELRRVLRPAPPPLVLAAFWPRGSTP